MKKINLFYCRCIVYFIFMLGICMNAVTVSGQEDDPITWVTSRDVAISTALSEGKYILLVAGSST